MKRTLYFLIITAGLCACGKDMLNLNDPGNFTPQLFYKTQADMDAAVIGAYGKLRDVYNGHFYFWGEIRSDNTGFYNPSIDKNSVNLLIPVRENYAEVENFWNSLYMAIIAANAILEKADGAVYTDENVKKQHIGEAEVIRALAYFYLARTYGGYALDGKLLGVPLVTRQVGAQAAREMPRASLEDTYKLITNDLADAVQNLPATAPGDNGGRFTGVSARALLGKVYMFMAGYPLNKGTEYYTKAAAELKAVAENSALSLVPSYVQLFNAANKNSKESIIEIQYQSDLTNKTGNAFQSQMLSNAAAAALVPAGDAGSGDNKPASSLLSAYAAGDPRKSVAFRPGYKDAGGVYRREAYGHKYWQKLGEEKSSVDSYLNWNCNWKEMRLAEVYLLYAEALIRSGGDKNTALLYLNKIRERARTTSKTEDVTIGVIETQFPDWNTGNPAVTLKDYVLADFASDAAFLLAIENESRVEFALENKRWYDLVRTQRAPQVMPPALAADENTNVSWNDRDYALPIPQNAMLTAPGALTQNTGYVQL
ncbi:RagB/SusD family nutrient uptake outer membrane protein [Chitinophaga sp.]|uniref:RagB/SusD family nutrient uptake outer membrane protein n=1 Tax=Chitinophaga sp. TaxID=1869181 RepID=UPI0031DB8E5E